MLSLAVAFDFGGECMFETHLIFTQDLTECVHIADMWFAYLLRTLIWQNVTIKDSGDWIPLPQPEED